MPRFNSFTLHFHLHTHLVFVWFSLPFLPSLSLNYTAFSAHAASWHVVRLGSNILIFLQSDQNSFSVMLWVYKSSFHHVVPSNVKPCNGFEFSHSLSLPTTTTSHFMHFSLVYLLYAKEVYFCSFVTKSNNLIQHAPNIYPHVFNSFHRTIIHGESHRIFTSPPPSNSVSPNFTIELLPSVAHPIFLH